MFPETGDFHVHANLRNKCLDNFSLHLSMPSVTGIGVGKEAFSFFLCFFWMCFHPRFIFGAELKQELQVRQRSIHETPDNEKNVGVVSLPVAVTPLSDTTIRQKTTFDAGYEKSDPTKSPTFDSNKLPTTPTGSPQQQPPPVLKRKRPCLCASVWFRSCPD